MSKKRYFKVKYGFSASDTASIEEKDVEKAIYAQVEGIPVQLGNSFINGKNIISITPNYHKHTGWYEWYEPKDGNDWAQIERDCPNYNGVVEYYKDRVQLLMRTNRKNLIGQNIEIKELEAPKV